MFKKAIIAGVGVLALGAFFLGRDLFSYVSTTAGKMQSAVRESVPVEFEIERARKMVQNLVPEIRKNMHLVAKEEFEVERINKQITESEGKLAKDETEIMRLKNDLGEGKASFTYAGRTYNAQQVKLDLANRFERFKMQDATLASLREMHLVRQRSLDAVREKLDSMIVAKRQLAVEVENLEARLKMVEAREASSSYAFDDTQLGRAKELIGDLRSRLAVAEKLIDGEGDLADRIELEETAPENIVDQVTEYFGTRGGDAESQLAAEQPVIDDKTL